jgi:hypothetical protein
MTNLEPKQTPRLTTAGPPIYIHKFLTFGKENTADQTCGNLEKNKRQQRGGWQGKVGERKVHGAIEVWGAGVGGGNKSLANGSTDHRTDSAAARTLSSM